MGSKRLAHFIPLYHAVSNSPLPWLEQLYHVRSSNDFEKELEFLLKHFEPVELDGLTKEKSKRPVMHLTFDDGFKCLLESAVPILIRKGIPATFFINSAFVDNKSLMFRLLAELISNKLRKDHKLGIKLLPLLNSSDTKEIPGKLNQLKYSDTEILTQLAKEVEIDVEQFLVDQKPYFETDDLRQLQKHGFSLGSHSIDHPQFDLLSRSERLSQALGPLKTATNEISYSSAFAFPFTDHGVGSRSIDELANHFNFIFGSAGIKDENHPKHYQRFPMEKFQLVNDNVLKRSMIEYNLKRSIGKSSVNRSTWK